MASSPPGAPGRASALRLLRRSWPSDRRLCRRSHRAAQRLRDALLGREQLAVTLPTVPRRSEGAARADRNAAGVRHLGRPGRSRPSLEFLKERGGESNLYGATLGHRARACHVLIGKEPEHAAARTQERGEPLCRASSTPGEGRTARPAYRRAERHLARDCLLEARRLVRRRQPRPPRAVLRRAVRIEARRSQVARSGPGMPRRLRPTNQPPGEDRRTARKLATKMRLTQQSRYGARAAATASDRTATKKPWEFGS